MLKDSWRYVGWSESQLGKLHNYDPRDDVLDETAEETDNYAPFHSAEHPITTSFSTSILSDNLTLKPVLVTALVNLTLNQRKVLALRLDEDLTFAQIAEKLEITRQAAYQSYRGTIRALRRAVSAGDTLNLTRPPSPVKVRVAEIIEEKNPGNRPPPAGLLPDSEAGLLPGSEADLLPGKGN